LVEGNESAKGYVYILINPAFTGFLKIGKTTKSPEERASRISARSGVPAPYAVAWKALVNDCHKVERLIHQELAHTRSRTDREFFVVPLSEAIATASSVVDPYLCEVDEPHRQHQSQSDSKSAPPTPVSKPIRRQRSKNEELILVAEDCKVDRAKPPPYGGGDKTIARHYYEVLIENPYRYTEEEARHEVHFVRRGRRDLKLPSYNIKRSPLVQRYGWGIHRNSEGKLALVPRESDTYRQLKDSIKTTKGWRRRRK
jgi:hypothetical protein